MTAKCIGITGQGGFIGTHLANYLQMQGGEVELVPFKKSFFEQPDEMVDFVCQCDTVVHLAALNRGNPDEIYSTNIRLVHRLIDALESGQHAPHVIFSSSTQESLDNPYGRSKHEGARLFSAWAERNGSSFTSLIIPHVFGPFGRPFYNSVVATFCYQLVRGQEPKIDVDAPLRLVYVWDLVKAIHRVILDEHTASPVYIEQTAEMTVSEILDRLRTFHEMYYRCHIFPRLENYFDTSLFNVFRSAIDDNHFPVYPDVHADSRGYLVEILKEFSGGQVFFSVTEPQITRGNHFHTRKIERFCVIQGEAIIRLRRIGTDQAVEYSVDGSHPSFVDIPVFHTHNITNVGDSQLLTLFWTSELFNPDDSDTFYEAV
jgi:UDP-2-acetamido-2,6-beta-L-arabino-hexul-4-ose reductase